MTSTDDDMANMRQWWDALGVGGVIIIGLALFFFPEPVTSFIGIIIILVAVLIWLGGWYNNRKSRNPAS